MTTHRRIFMWNTLNTKQLLTFAADIDNWQVTPPCANAGAGLAELHQAELLEDWQLCMNKQQPKQIAPLQ
jgi:hypothetical protein